MIQVHLAPPFRVRVLAAPEILEGERDLFVQHASDAVQMRRQGPPNKRLVDRVDPDFRAQERLGDVQGVQLGPFRAEVVLGLREDPGQHGGREDYGIAEHAAERVGLVVNQLLDAINYCIHDKSLAILVLLRTF